MLERSADGMNTRYVHQVRLKIKPSHFRLEETSDGRESLANGLFNDRPHAQNVVVPD